MSSCDSSSLGLWGGEGEDIIKRDFPIHMACRDGDIQALRIVCATASSRGQLLSEDKFYGWAPIHWAAYFGNIDCLNELLSIGVSSNLCTSKFKQTPCHIAAFGGHPQCILKLLRSGANFYAQDYLGETPIHKAARVGNVESISVLLANGSRVNFCNNNGHTPCDLARIQGFLECVKLLETPRVEFSRVGDLNSGSTGGFMTGFDGNNVANGHCRSRKRIVDDESIPSFKRCRLGFTGEERQVQYNGQHKNKNTGNGLFTVDNDLSSCMETEDVASVEVDRFVGNEHVDVFPRAPSPGMDMQLWGHENGYGDTAETMPSPTKHTFLVSNGNRHDRPTCAAFRGIQSRGWH